MGKNYGRNNRQNEKHNRHRLSICVRVRVCIYACVYVHVLYICVHVYAVYIYAQSMFHHAIAIRKKPKSLQNMAIQRCSDMQNKITVCVGIQILCR